MVDFIPNKKADLKNDDIQDIERDITKLAAKYMAPVDAIRSIVKPINVTSKNADECVYEVEKDDRRPLESRAHAFLRYIGFPVAVKSGEFYNPGFDPNGSLQKTRRSDVNKKFLDADIKSVIFQREENPEITRDLFGREDLSASLYAILLTSIIRPFNNLKDGVRSLDVDYQEFNAQGRQLAVDDFFITNDNLNRSDAAFLAEILGATYTKGTHVLKPFVVDPAIDCMAMPAKNRIAVPFLQNKDKLKVTDSISVHRPGLELIIRERLRASEVVDGGFLETVKQILNNEIAPSTQIQTQTGTIVGQDLISTVSALLGDFDIETSEINELKDLTVVQTQIIVGLVRTLKSIINTLHDSLKTVFKVRNDINWIPIPNPEGPELGGFGAKLRTQDVSSKENIVDRVIVKLKTQKIIAEHQITSVIDLGVFASPFNVTTNDADLANINNELNNLEQKRDKIANNAFKAMGNIELIMGEVSGLGLIDVLSIYIALWSMNEDSLISLLDNESFKRLKVNFPDLIVGAAVDREDNGGAPRKDIVTALDDFESKLKNVLKFAEVEFSRKFSTDGEESGGDISADS